MKQDKDKKRLRDQTIGFALLRDPKAKQRHLAKYVIYMNTKIVNENGIPQRFQRTQIGRAFSQKEALEMIDEVKRTPQNFQTGYDGNNAVYRTRRQKAKTIESYHPRNSKKYVEIILGFDIITHEQFIMEKGN